MLLFVVSVEVLDCTRSCFGSFQGYEVGIVSVFSWSSTMENFFLVLG